MQGLGEVVESFGGKSGEMGELWGCENLKIVDDWYLIEVKVQMREDVCKDESAPNLLRHSTTPLCDDSW